MRRIFSFLCVLILAFTLSSCGNGKNQRNGFPVTVGGVVINEKPQKIAVTSAALKEAMVSLGYGSVTVDVSAQFLTGVGDLTGGDTAISIILTNEEIYPAQSTILAGKNAKVITVALPKTLADVKVYWDTLSKVADGTIGASRVGDTYKRLSEEVNNLKSTNLSAVLITGNGVCAVNGIEAEALLKAGYSNAAAERESGAITDSELAELNPDVIFCISGLKDSISNSTDLANIKAVKSGRVFEVDVFGIRFGTDVFKIITEMNGAVNVADDKTDAPDGSNSQNELESTVSESSIDE